MHLSSSPCLTLAALALVASWTTAAHAQTGRITGAITDPSRAVVPGATLTIVNAETTNTRVAISNDGGQYNVPFLPSGRYTVSCELPGFQTTRREGIPIVLTSREPALRAA
jgi:hypothetical protein